MRRINNRDQEKLRKRLKVLLRQSANAFCADCGMSGPVWASVNLGLFICMECAGVHRGIGVHITKVKSCTMDTWTTKEVNFMQSIGNEKANSYWNAKLRPFESIAATVESSKRTEFIRDKYERRKYYAAPAIVEPSRTPQDEPTKPISRTQETKSRKPRHAQSGKVHGMYQGMVVKESEREHSSQPPHSVGRKQAASPWVTKPTAAPTQPAVQPATQSVVQPATPPSTSLFEGMIFKDPSPTEMNVLNTDILGDLSEAKQTMTTAVPIASSSATTTTDTRDFDLSNSSFSFLQPDKKIENEEVIKQHDNLFNECFVTGTRRRSSSNPNPMRYKNQQHDPSNVVQQNGSAFSFISNSGPSSPVVSDTISDLSFSQQKTDPPSQENIVPADTASEPSNCSFM